jgi:hypothetical protein
MDLSNGGLIKQEDGFVRVLSCILERMSARRFGTLEKTRRKKKSKGKK